MALANEGFLEIGGMKLEYRMIGPRPHEAPTIVMLHEGLGSVSMWGDFPERLAERAKAGVFVYSRAGYGRSSPVAARPPTSTTTATSTWPSTPSAAGWCCSRTPARPGTGSWWAGWRRAAR